jgi:predicted DNA-binding transcriptional regulator YafY
MNATTDIKYQQSQRLRYIELICLWEGAINTNAICEYFGIGRQQASKDLKIYRESIAPQNLVYNGTSKRYEITPHSAVFTDGAFSEYLHFTNKPVNQSFTHALPLPEFSVSPGIFRVIKQACRDNLRLEVDYRSVNAPDKSGRIIVPHAIAHSGTRWHVRAFCEKNQDFRDFVLSRFKPEIDILGNSDIDANQDEAWHTFVTVTLIPDQRLTQAQQQVVADDYGMSDMRLDIKVRASLLTYLLQMLRLNGHTIHADPKAQQVVVANIAEIKRWMF